MVKDNHYYGHAHVLRKYIGVDDSFRFPCGIQHGWTTGPGLWEGAFRLPWWKIVWSQRNLEVCATAGYERCRAIGAPYIYLPEQAEEPRPRDSQSLLVFPSHGWEQRKLRVDFERYAESVARLEAGGFGPITVCMYWIEYEQLTLRSFFEGRGWKVITMGHREGNPEFLFRQRDLIQAHAFVTSNRLQTVSFYALFSGRPFFLHGPFEGMTEIDDPTGEIFARWCREHFPMLHYDTFDGRVYREIAERELGFESKLSRRELRELFDMPWYGADEPRSMPQRLRKNWNRLKRHVWTSFHPDG